MVPKLDYEYNYHGSLLERAQGYLPLAWQADLGNRQGATANWVENTGDGLLWLTDRLYSAVEYVVLSFRNPSVLTVAITAIALAALSFAFYPATAILAVATAWHFTALLVSQIPLWAVRFTAYIGSCAWILGHGLRALGRFTNDDLMQRFYNIKMPNAGLNQKTHDELLELNLDRPLYPPEQQQN